MNNERTYIGVDLGGTKVLAAKVNTSKILETSHRFLPKDNGDPNVVINLLKEVISNLMSEEIEAIGIGLPSIVDSKKGIVYDVHNIPSWKEVHLVDILSEYFQIPVFINNDANCYALGEAHFGLGKNCDYMVGLTIGTGLGAGIVYKGKLLDDATGASGEFGIIPYLDKTVEDYCSGQYFKDNFKSSGEKIAKDAKNGDLEAINAYEQFGMHLGNAIKIIMATIDPNKIIIGGSVAQSKSLFEKKMWQSINNYPFEKSIKNIKIEFSETNNMAVLGASTLCYQYAEIIKE